MEPIAITSIAQVHAFVGRPPPLHPLITVIGAPWQPPLQITAPLEGHRIHSEVFAVSLKRGDECRLAFGRQTHDAQAGTVAFLMPGQSLTPLVPLRAEAPGELAWTLIFHPDLLNSARLHEHAFFRYAAEEALHLTDAEQATLTDLIRKIDHEAHAAPDTFSRDVLNAHLDLFFSYCRRFYARQFHARSQREEAVLTRLLLHLDAYLASQRPLDMGLPTVADCARALGYSPDYLSDLLREETGESTRDHIHRALIEAAKRRLNAGTESVSEIAYALGFEQPQHFSKLFKQKTGSTPSEWRRAFASG